MNLNVKLTNISNFEHSEFNFRSGCINILEMPNAAGKSAILKAIATAYSFPLKSRIAEESATRLGIWRKVPPQPLAKIGSSRGIIEIKANGDVRTCIIETQEDIIVNQDGDEKFLFTSFVSIESELFRRISGGEDSLKWLLPAVSKVEDYERVLNVVFSIFDKIEKSLQITKDKKSHLELLKSEIERTKEELTIVEQELEDINQEIEKAKDKMDPELKKKYEKTSANIENLRTKINEKEKEVKNSSNDLRRLAKEIERHKKELEDIDTKISEIDVELKQLGTDKEVKREIENIEKELDDLGKKRAIIQYRLKMFKSALSLNEGTCPLCGSGEFNKNYIQNRIEETQRELNKTDSEARAFTAKKENLARKLERIKDLNKKLPELLDKKQYIEREIDKLHREIEPIELKTRSLDNEIKALKSELAEKEELLNKLREKIMEKSEVKELYRKIELLLERKGELSARLSQKYEEIEEISKINILEREIPLDRAEELCKLYIAALNEVLNWLKNRINEQKKGFAERFNKSIDNVITRLKFKNLKVWIDSEDLRILIKRGESHQLIASLSLSEKSVIAVLLQIAIKEAFLPKVPIFLIDEVITDFDKERAYEVIKYLLEVAKEKDWIIILAKVGEKSSIMQISSIDEITKIF